MDSEDNIQSFIGRRFILPFIVLFSVNILVICYELNTGFENIFNEENNFACTVFILTQVLNSLIIALVVMTISLYIGYKLESHRNVSYFIVVLSPITSFFTSCVLTEIWCRSINTEPFGAQMSADSRLQIQCTVLLVTQIGLFVLYYYWTKY